MQPASASGRCPSPWTSCCSRRGNPGRGQGSREIARNPPAPDISNVWDVSDAAAAGCRVLSFQDTVFGIPLFSTYHCFQPARACFPHPGGSTHMKILFVGAGAVGTLFGASLHQHGADVQFLLRPARKALVDAEGLTLE